MKLTDSQIGCGTAIPSTYLLQRLLSSDTPLPETTTHKTILHMQDYNHSVLSLVTLPNLLLASLPSLPATALRSPDRIEDVESTLPDLNEAGELSITPELVHGFTALLAEKGVELRFTYGDWSGLAETLKDQEPYDLVLTAETIYSQDSVGSLVRILKTVSKRRSVAEKKTGQASDGEGHVEVELEQSLEDLRLVEKWDDKPLPSQDDTVILVGAKVRYLPGRRSEAKLLC